MCFVLFYFRCGKEANFWHDIGRVQKLLEESGGSIPPPPPRPWIEPLALFIYRKKKKENVLISDGRKVINKEKGKNNCY